MVKKGESLGIGSLVFARLKGYPPWPAKIVKAEKKKYYVYFYGTGEKSPAMKPEDLYEYNKHKAQFVVDKNLKRKFYTEAVDQIEAALRGEQDVASINNTSANDDVLDNSQDESEVVAAENQENSIAEGESNANETAPTDVVEEEVEKVVVPVKEKPAKKSVSKAPPSAVTESEPKDDKSEVETSEPEIVSRSGRKIKTKRYLIDELEETVTPVLKKRAVDVSDNNKNTENSVPKAKPVTPVKQVPNPEKDMILQIESHLIELDHLIKASVGLKNANADKCLEHLNEYKTLKITPLMLKKRPGVVQTMKRLRRYVGNANKWEMDESMKADFDDKAQKIRLKAEEIYSSFKLMFPHSEQKTFWDHFSEQVDHFQNKVKGLTQDQVSDLYEEPITPPSSPKSDVQNNNGSEIV
uniref:CSON015118 protein n=1 Tax=Culicoides sonorensis TaxID=179676 RepID=A0A336KSE7_CULSO